MSITYSVSGVEDIRKSIKKLDSRKARNLLQRALNQAANPVVKDARTNADRNVGKRTGEGRKNIKKRNIKKAERERLGLDQGVEVYLASDGFYLGFWEMGFTRNGIHYAAKPWLRPAIDMNEAIVIKRYKERAKVLVEREVAKGK